MLLILGLAVGLQVGAADWIKATIVTTNKSVHGDSLTVNGSTRIATNAATSTTWLTNATAAGTATNLFSHLANNPAAGVLLGWPSNQVLTLQGQDLAVSVAGTWAELTLVTNIGITNGTAVMIPFDRYALVVRTNQASEIAYGLKYSSNAVPAGIVGLSNYASLSGTQTLANKTLTAPAINGGLITGATLTNSSSPGSGINSLSLGASSAAAGNNATSLGNGASAAGESAISIGDGSLAGMLSAIAIGAGSEANATNATVIGTSASASGYGATAIGQFSSAPHPWSTAIGAGVIATDTNQVRLGLSTNTVSIPGILAAAVQTNSTFKGTSTLSGSWTETITALASLANGNNVLDASNYATIRIDAGPTAAYSVCSIVPVWPGRVVRLLNNCAAVMTLPNESGYEATAANRIKTYNAADATATTNAFVELIYDGGASRWRIRNIYP